MRRIQYPRGYQKLRISPILRANSRTIAQVIELMCGMVLARPMRW